MYKLIIADDEPKIVSLLCKIVNWEELGFEIVYTANDGRDVADYITRHNADCILSDIKMIDMSGIELAEYVYNNHPKIKVILLSAYQEFEYAVNALKYNVYSYISKPLNVDELISTFKSLKQSLDKTASDSELIAYYIRSTLSDLVDGKFKSVYDIVPLLKLVSKNNITIDENTSCCILKIKCLPDWKNNTEDMHINFLSNIAQLSECNIITHFYRLGENIIEYIMFSNTSSGEVFENTAAKISENLSTFLGTPADIVECICRKHISDLFTPVNKAQSFAANVENFKNSFAGAVKTGTVFDITEYISILFKLELPLSDVKEIILAVISSLSSTSEMEGSEEENNVFEEFSSNTAACNNISELKGLCEKYFVKISELFQSLSDDNIKADIIRVRNYIFEHHTEYISLNETAKMIHLSPKYFSKKFKQIVGETFSDFIISCRMNHAKELLIKTNERISQIAATVGYNNPNFFATLFKKYYNIPPSKYREKYSVTGGDSSDET